MALEEMFVTGATGFMKKLVSSAAKKIGSAGAVDKDLQKLKDKLEMIGAVTSDAEKKQVKDKVVQLWLRRLQDVAYDADDLLDEISYEAMRQSQEDGTAGKVTVLSKIKFGLKVAKRIKIINQELDEIAKDNAMFLLEHSIDDLNVEQLDRETVSFIGDSKIVGRGKDTSRVVKMVLTMNPSSSSSSSGNSSSQENVSVVSIVGMGGVGKTTLAQLVYKDNSIERSFESRAWVCISDNFDIFLILKNIFESFTGAKCDDFSNVSVLVEKVHKVITGKKYLLVLDDLWNESSEDWEKLKGYLSGGARGSKILVTTRKADVASIVRGTIPPYNLGTLNTKECWSIIKSRAFSPGGAVETPTLSNIGEEISRKCAGLPLAAVFLGSLMRLKRNESDWLSIRDDDVFNTPENPNKIILILKLSYDNLSSNLKKCFSYCSLFPKDYEFSRETLIHLWMAEGFLHPSTGGKQNSPEEIGDDYVLSLLSSSFIQDVRKDSVDDIKSFKMHDLVHDLALSVVGSHEVSILKRSEMENDASQIRRLQFVMEEGARETSCSILNNAEKLRTIFCQEEGFFYPIALRNKRLRVLYRLGSDSLATLCSSSFKFKHMRYLDLSFSNLEDVHAQSIYQLHNLQTLNLHRAQNIQEIINHISSLNNLRHLNLSYSDVDVLPDCICKLTSLQTLDISATWIFVLPINIGSLQNLVSLKLAKARITELPDSICLIHGLRNLTIWRCQNLKSLPRDLGALKQLRSLNVEGTQIKELPESLSSSLCKLERVILGYECKFPKDVRNWVELRKLTYDRKEGDIRMPRGIENLTRLEVLVPYMVREEEEEVSTGSSIHELADLNSLRRITIRDLKNVRGGKAEAERVKLKYKQNIQNLELQWKNFDEKEGDEVAAATATKVLKGLQPHSNLEVLNILSYSGLKLPKWMGSPSCLPNLVELRLFGGKNCANPVGLGQLPCLKELTIMSMDLVKCLGPEFYYQHLEEEEEDGNENSANATTTLFPSLTRLDLSLMDNLRKWVAPDNSFPCLENLEIMWCYKLKYIPDLRLLASSLRRLRISSCGKRLKRSLPYDLKKDLPFLETLETDW